jgi:hypothetical protein
MFVELEYMTMPALHFEGQNGSADVKWSQMFLGRQGNPFRTRQEQKHETHRNPSALILMNLNDLHLESRRSHAHKCTAYTTCCLHWCESGWKRKARRTNMRNEIEMTGMSLLTTPDDLFLIIFDPSAFIGPEMSRVWPVKLWWKLREPLRTRWSILPAGPLAVSALGHIQCQKMRIFGHAVCHFSKTQDVFSIIQHSICDAFVDLHHCNIW